MGGELFQVTHTKVLAFDQCRKKYWFSYVSGLPRPATPVSVAGVLGNGIHRALKVVCDTNETARGAEELDTYLRMPIHEAMAPGTEHYSTAFQLFEAGCAAHLSIESEDRWAEVDTWAPWPSQGVSLRARIDRADRLSPGNYQVIDWKTGVWDFPETVDAQLDIGHVALRVSHRLREGDTVRAVSWNLRSGERRERTLLRRDAEATMAKMVALARRMQAETEFEPHPGPACTFCDWRPQCPEANAEWRE